MQTKVDRIEPLSEGKMPRPLLEQAFRTMLRIRAFEERVGDVVEANEVHTPCHLYIGQEAVAAGVCAALNKEDTVWGGHRSHGHYLAKGGDMKAMMAEIFGRKAGCSEGRGGSMHVVAPEVGVLGTVPLVAATIPLAVGAALAAKLKKNGAVAVSFFGDGATEEGHFHESVNLAAVYQLPVIFVCENNFYSSHMGLLQRRREDNIDRSGAAHGIPAARIDGNDVIAVYDTTTEAVRRARQGGGPTLIECRTYRWRGHVGPAWDMDVGVKRKDELKEWFPKDPVARVRQKLAATGSSEASLDAVEKEARAEVEAALEYARKAAHPAATEVLEHVFRSERMAQ